MVVVPPDPPPITNPPDGQDCTTCKYGITRSYGDVTNTKVVLECRYADPDVQGTLGVWPQVKQSDWCGRWTGK